MTTRLYIVRHGRTDWNAMRRFQGSIERELDEEGKRQAKEASLRFADISFSAIYSSSMIRAKQTAEIIAGPHGLEVTPIRDLQEISYGSFDGILAEEFEKQFAPLLEIKKSLQGEEYFRFSVHEEMETGQQILDRVLPRLKELCTKHPHQTILVVAHGAVMRTLLAYLKGPECYHVSIPNTGHIHLYGDGDQFDVLHYEEQH